MTDAHLKAARRFAIWTFVKASVALVAIFILVRVVTPDLINTHDDILSALGLLSAFAAPVIGGWATVSIFIDARRFIGEISGGKP